MENEKQRRDARFRKAIYVRLVDQLFGTVGSMVSAMFASLVVAIVCWSRTQQETFLWTALAMLAMVVARATLLGLYQRDKTRQGIAGIGVERMRRWERAYVVGTLLWSATIGYTSYLGALSGDGIVELFCGLMVVGCLGGSVGRNAARPSVLVVQLAALAAPYSLGLWQTGEVWHRGILVLVACMSLALRSSTRQVNGALVGAMTKEVEIRETNGHFEMTLDNVNQGICLVDREMRVVVVNDRFNAILGCEAEVGQLLAEACHMLGGDIGDLLENATPAEGLRGHTNDGRMVEMRITSTKEGDANVFVVEDITTRVAAERSIDYMASHDSLTGLPNKRIIHKTIDDAVAEMEAGGRPFAVLALDLDKFKEVNDTLGHPVGDQLLQDVAERLSGSIRPQDLVGRIGGDEFIVVMRGEHPELMAERLVATMSRPYQIDINEVRIGVSIGIAASERGTGTDEMRKRADMALYRAKANPTVRHCTYEPALGLAARERSEMAADLRVAIAEGDLVLHFQPIVDVRTGTVGCCEALVRWNRRMPDGSRKMVRPDQFIGLAEETGLIVPLGGVVLRKACLAAAEWPNDIRVAVNVSALQMIGDTLRKQVSDALLASNLPGHRLELEITESQSMEDIATAAAIMADMAKMGVQIALDDFGTGCSSLAYLHQLAFSKVKVDRTFMRAALENHGARALVKMIADFTAATGKSLVIEGVEKDEELAVMRGLGASLIQGYMFSKPVPDEELRGVLARIDADQVETRTRCAGLVVLKGGRAD